MKNLKDLTNNELCKEFVSCSENISTKFDPKEIKRFADIDREICERFLRQWYEEI